MTRDEEAVAAIAAHLAECTECQIGILSAVLTGEVEALLAQHEAHTAPVVTITAVWRCGICRTSLHVEDLDGEEAIMAMGALLMAHTWEHLQEAQK